MKKLISILLICFSFGQGLFGQTLTFGLGINFSQQKITNVEESIQQVYNSESSKVDQKTIFAQSLNFSTAISYKYFYGSLMYQFYKQQLALDGSTSSGYSGLGGSSSSRTDFNYTVNNYFNVGILSFGISILPKGKFNVIPIAFFGCQQRQWIKEDVNYAKTISTISQYTLGTYSHEYIHKASEVILFENGGFNMFIGFHLKLSYLINPTFGFAVDVGYKFYKNPEFSVGRISTGNEWFTGITLNYTLKLKKVKKSNVLPDAIKQEGDL